MTTATLPTPTRKPTPLSPTPRVLRAVIKKELQQNLLVLCLMLALETIAIFIAEWFRSGFLNFRPDEYINILLYPSVRAAIPLACAIAALTLGIAQPLFDLNFDRWAFLIHRPATRLNLFLGRILAGFILYFFACGLPLLILFTVAATSAGGIYFMRQYTYPPIVDFTTGFAWYFAGLLLTERQARYYGSRVVPLVLALAASACSQLLPTMTLALLSNLLFIAPLALAAAGSYASHGYTLRSPTLLRAALALSLLAGFSLTFFAISLPIRQNLQVRRPFPRDQFLSYPRKTTYQRLLPDGSLITQTTLAFFAFHGQPNLPGLKVHWDAASNRYIAYYTVYTDLQGHPIPEPPDLNWQDVQTVAAQPRDLRPTPPRAFREIDRLVDKMQRNHSGPNGESLYIDYWLFDTTRNFYIIYRGPILLGKLGADGRLSQSTPTPFEKPRMRGEGPVIQTPHVIYKLDFDRYTAQPLFTAPAGETIIEFRTNTRKNTILTGYAVLTNAHAYFLSPTGQTRATMPLTHDLDKLICVVRYFPDQQRLVAFWYGRGDQGETIREFYDPKGTLLHSLTSKNFETVAPPKPAPVLPRGYHTKLRQLDMQQGAYIAAGNPSLLLLTSAVGRVIFPPEDSELELPHDPFHPPLTAWTWATLSVTLLAFTALTFLAATLYRAPRRLLWTLLTLLTGPAALLTFLATHTWQTRTRCPTCRKLRPLVKDLCPHCNSPWPAPQQTGTEILSAS